MNKFAQEETGGLSPAIIRLFAVRDNRTDIIRQVRIDAAHNYRVDERDDNNTQANPGKEIKRRGLIRLNESPERKADREHAQNR